MCWCAAGQQVGHFVWSVLGQHTRKLSQFVICQEIQNQVFEACRLLVVFVSLVGSPFRLTLPIGALIRQKIVTGRVSILHAVQNGSVALHDVYMPAWYGLRT